MAETPTAARLTAPSRQHVIFAMARRELRLASRRKLVRTLFVLSLVPLVVYAAVLVFSVAGQEALNVDLGWDGDTSTCRSCHSGDAVTAPTMDSGKHENHVNQASVIGTNYECATCHDLTVSTGNNEVITGFGNHVNGAKTVSGTNVDSPYVSPTCTASYCHSSGQDPAVTTPVEIDVLSVTSTPGAMVS